MNPASLIETIALTSKHLWIVFALALVLFAIMSLILFYHWWRYRSHNVGVVVAGIIYLSVSALLIMMTVTSLFLMSPQ